MGIDQITGTSRFTYEVPELFDRISIVVITVSVLAVGEVLHVASRHGRSNKTKLIPSTGRPWLSKKDFRKALPAWLRGAGIGIPFGVVPVGGSEVPTFLSYTTERTLDSRSKEPEFGTGAIKGVAGPEAAGNATAGSAIGALLALGLPTSATAALMIAAFQQYGMQPGPLLFERNSDIVWALLASLFLASIVLLILNLPFAPIWAKLLMLPQPYLYAGITVFAALGVYATGASTTDLVIMCLLGGLAFLMRRYGVPLAPVMIAVVLGPLAENSLREAMANSNNDPATLISSGITITLYSVLLISCIWIAYRKIRNRRILNSATAMPAEPAEPAEPATKE